jgi:hypothetical protein
LPISSAVLSRTFSAAQETTALAILSRRPPPVTASRSSSVRAEAEGAKVAGEAV